MTEHPVADGDEGLGRIRDFAAGQAAVLDDLAGLLAALRAAVGDPGVRIDTEALWLRVLARLERLEGGPP